MITIAQYAPLIHNPSQHSERSRVVEGNVPNILFATCTKLEAPIRLLQLTQPFPPSSWLGS